MAAARSAARRLCDPVLGPRAAARDGHRRRRPRRPIALSLAAAGFELVIVDPDVVELSNLPRQIHFTTQDLGQPKATRLAGLVVARGGQARGVVARWLPQTPTLTRWTPTCSSTAATTRRPSRRLRLGHRERPDLRDRGGAALRRQRDGRRARRRVLPLPVRGARRGADVQRRPASSGPSSARSAGSPRRSGSGSRAATASSPARSSRSTTCAPTPRASSGSRRGRAARRARAP